MEATKKISTFLILVLFRCCFNVYIIDQVPALALDEGNFSLWGSGEWWMLLAAQSMAVGTVMVRWVSMYSDPVMATGWVSQASSDGY